jgi:hypothetical protein
VVGALVVSIAVLTSYSAWRVYETAALPLRAPVAVSRAGPAVRLDDRKAVKRAQRVKELLGEANAYRAAKRQEWADEALGKALALDPANAEARAIRASWDANPLPPLTPEEIAAREREAHLAQLLGAAGTIMEASEALPPPVVEEVRGYIEEALALAPDDPTALALVAELPAS